MKRKQKSHISGNFYHLERFTLFDTMRTLCPPSFWGKNGQIVLNTGRLEGAST